MARGEALESQTGQLADPQYSALLLLCQPGAACLWAWCSSAWASTQQGSVVLQCPALLLVAGYAFCFANWNPPVFTEPDVLCPSGYEVTQQYGKPLW